MVVLTGLTSNATREHSRNVRTKDRSQHASHGAVQQDQHKEKG
jgi:hypothetical protein